MEFRKTWCSVRFGSNQDSVIGAVLFCSGFCLVEVSVRLGSRHCSTERFRCDMWFITVFILGTARVDDGSQL